ncbi:hypothetical protein ACVJ5M_001470 [Bradyrhizobium sp. S3.7.6]
MNETARKPRVAGFALFTLFLAAVLVALGVWQLQRRVAKHQLIAALTERLAAAPVALPPPSQWSTLTPERDEFRRVTFSATYESRLDAMVYSSGSAIRSDISGPGTWGFPSRTAAWRRYGRGQRGLRAEHPTGPRPAGSGGRATHYQQAGDVDRLRPFPRNSQRADA